MYDAISAQLFSFVQSAISSLKAFVTLPYIEQAIYGKAWREFWKFPWTFLILNQADDHVH
ncbi:MAG: hypothetical protein ACJAXN_002929 [Psychromonas sp.]